MTIEEYKPSVLTRQLQQLQLEMSKVLLDFCVKHNLKIWACFGTLIGAARHKGFIPWDDDIDFVMMRNDYDRLLELSKDTSSDLLLHGLSFDTSDICVIKLRNNNTTMLLPSFKWTKDLNQGIWVDIFCLDTAPDNMNLIHQYDSLNRKVRLVRNCSLCCYATNPNFQYRIKHFLIKFFFVFSDIQKKRNEIESFLREEARRSSGEKLWAWLIWGSVKKSKYVARFERQWFKDTVLLPFEDIQIPCPIGWDELLTAQYGDWKTPVMGSSLHEGCEIYLNKSYKSIIEDHLSALSFWQRYLHTH